MSWTGQELLTLDECGKRIGLTRERIRQIQQRIIGKIAEHSIFMPGLDKALVLLEQLAPISLSDAAYSLHRNGITSKEFSPYGILEAAKLLGRETTLSVCEISGQKVIVNAPQPIAYRAVSRAARKLAGQSGITNVFQVTDLIKEKGFEIEELEIKKALKSINNFDFLD